MKTSAGKYDPIQKENAGRGQRLKELRLPTRKDTHEICPNGDDDLLITAHLSFHSLLWGRMGRGTRKIFLQVENFISYLVAACNLFPKNNANKQVTEVRRFQNYELLGNQHEKASLQKYLGSVYQVLFPFQVFGG